MKTLIPILFILSFCTGCHTFRTQPSFNDLYTVRDAESTVQMQEVIKTDAEKIQEECKVGRKIVKKANLGTEVVRYERINKTAKNIEVKAKKSKKKANSIRKRTEPGLKLPWYLWLILITVIMLIITGLLKQWGLMGAVRTLNKSAVSGLASIIDNADFNNSDVDDDEIQREIRNYRKNKNID